MIKLALPLVAGAVLWSGTAPAHPAADLATRLEQARSAGLIDQDRYFLERFHYIFAPENVDPRFATGFLPVKDATALVIEYERARPALRAATTARIDALLEPALSEDIYDTEHFRIAFDRSGANAVPAADEDGSGIPDYVEDLGDYAEYSLWIEVEEMGFTAPVLDPKNGGRLLISLQEMNAYGSCSCPLGTCSIKMDNDFAGFPENDDPDGDVAGAAKVTIAHELKHAIQNAASGWTEGSWVELDATWMEDQAYPDTNDYINYINSSKSQIVTPTDPLDKGGAGTYYDAIWQTSMSERLGIDFIVGFWEHRSSHRTETVLESYDAVLRQAGSSLARHFSGDYMVRNYLTASRAAGSSPVYPDAAKFEEGPVTTLAWPVNVNRRLEHLSGEFLEVSTPVGSATTPKITIDAPARGSFGLAAVLWRRDGSMTRVEIPVSRGRGAVTVTEPWANLSRVGLIVTNAATDGRAQAYTLTVQ